jgi:hypothetical protein
MSNWSFSIEFADSYFAHSSDARPPEVSASPPQKTPQATGLPPGTFLTKDGYIGAVSSERLDQVMQLIASNDRAALEQLLATGWAFMLKGGLEVTVVDHEGLLGSVVKIRKRGTLAELWTVREALDIR